MADLHARDGKIPLHGQTVGITLMIPLPTNTHGGRGGGGTPPTTKPRQAKILLPLLNFYPTSVQTLEGVSWLVAGVLNRKLPENEHSRDSFKEAKPV